LGEVGDAEDEADGVEDVGFAGAVEAGDGVEVGIEAVCGWREKMDVGVGRSFSTRKMTCCKITPQAHQTTTHQ
jgi:hypothetical protein